MKRLLKILKRTVITILILFLVGYVAYQIAYPYVAPMVFDYLVEKNAQMFVQLEESLEASVGTEPVQGPEIEPPVVDGAEVESSPAPDLPDLPQPEQTPVATAPPKKPNTEIQTVHTTMGDFTGPHLVRALKNISPADKTRIISICQQAVSMSDMLTVSQILMSDGLTVEQQKFIENYLRDNLPNSDKAEILRILKKY